MNVKVVPRFIENVDFEHFTHFYTFVENLLFFTSVYIDKLDLNNY